ncbi:hypothetical protein U1839_15135 [Sphingomonas sp. RT2P30]|uniref:hypothetical protein n=1 Tax=Parasphingomonas halimpatiens TaxID=3096162 RepID=UPI002FC67248
MRRMLVTLAAIASTLSSVAAARTDDAATSPDGRYRAWVKVERPPAVDALDRGITSLWLTDIRTGARRMVVRGDNRPSPGADSTAFWGPHFSMDGKSVYLSVVAGEVSAGTFRVDLRTGARRFMTLGGGVVGVMRTGPYAGCLLVKQHRYWAKGGSYNPVLLLRHAGKQIMMIPGSDKDDGGGSVGRWLRTKGWRAS